MKLQDSTQKEVEGMLKCGMKKITPAEFREAIDMLGFKVSEIDTFFYINPKQACHYTYRAKALYIIEKSTGLGFGNVESDCYKNRDNGVLDQLQEFRRETFVFERGVIWEY